MEGQTEDTVEPTTEMQETGETGAEEANEQTQPPKREREPITLDTPVPEMPENRLPEPNEHEHEAKLSAIDAKIQILRSKIDNTYTEMKEIREMGKSRLGDGQTGFIAETREDRQRLSAQRKAYIDELRALKKDFYEMIEENKKIRNKVKIQDYEKVEQRIAEIRRKLETTSNSLQEEKALVAELKELENSRPFTIAFMERKELIDANRARQEEIQTVLDANESRRKEIEETVQERRAEQDELSSDIPNLANAKDEYKKEIDELRDARRAQITKYRAERKEYNEQQRTIKQIKFIKDIQKKIRDRLKREEAWKQRQAEIDEEEALFTETKAWQDEIGTCHKLISYLQRYLPKTAEEEKKAEPAAAPSAGMADPNMVPVMGKKAQLEMEAAQSWGGGRNKKQKKQRVRNKQQTTTTLLQHPMEMLNSFGYLIIKPPNTIEEIPDCISALKAKAEYFETLDEEAEPEVHILNIEESKKQSGKSGQQESFPEPLQSNTKEGYGLIPEEKLDRLEKPKPEANTRGQRGRGRRPRRV